MQSKQTNKQTNKTKQQQKLHVMQRFFLVSKLWFALGLFTTERPDANHSYEKWPWKRGLKNTAV